MLRRRRQCGGFLVMLSLPFSLVVLFGHSLGVGQRAQLGKMFPPGFFLLRRETDSVLCLNLGLMRGGRRMMAGRMVLCGKGRRCGENSKGKQGG